jgi:hypothetical protein
LTSLNFRGTGFILAARTRLFGKFNKNNNLKKNWPVWIMLPEERHTRPYTQSGRSDSGLLYFCNLNKPGRRNKFDLNKAIPERGTIPTPGAASQGCLCKYPPAWVSTLRRRRKQRARRQERPQLLPSYFWEQFQQKCAAVLRPELRKSKETEYFRLSEKTGNAQGSSPWLLLSFTLLINP